VVVVVLAAGAVEAVAVELVAVPVAVEFGADEEAESGGESDRGSVGSVWET